MCGCACIRERYTAFIEYCQGGSCDILPIGIVIRTHTMLTTVNVGATKSIVTALESVVALTDVPTLLAKSSNVIAKLATPSLTSAAITVYVAVQAVPLPVTVAALPAIVTVGATIASFAVMLAVIVSPLFALILLPALLDWIVTVIVGMSMSIMTALESVTVVRVAPALPATSENTIDKLACTPDAT